MMALEFLQKASMERSWKRWAKKQNRYFNEEILFEESFIIEPVRKSLYFNNLRRDFGVKLDISLGELDRVLSMLGKLKTTITFKITKKVFSLDEGEWIEASRVGNKKEVKLLKKTFCGTYKRSNYWKEKILESSSMEEKSRGIGCSRAFKTTRGLQRWLF